MVPIATSLRAAPTPLKWGVLLAASLVFIVPLELIHLPAALLLGAMAAAILVAIVDGTLAVPRWPYVLAQGLIGCLVARSIGPAILANMLRQWPLFLGGAWLHTLVFEAHHRAERIDQLGFSQPRQPHQQEMPAG